MTAGREAAARAVAWLTDGIERFLPHKGANGKAEFRRLKAICEVSFIAALLQDSDGARDLSDAVAAALCEFARGGRLLTALAHQPQHANLYLPMLYAYCCEAPLSEPAGADAAQLLVSLATAHKERQPFRTLDFFFSLYLLTGNRAHLAAMETVAAFGCLGPTADVLSYTEGDEYAVTHSVFYLTAFGSQRWPFGSDSASNCRQLLLALSFDALASENWDLYSEYLCALKQLGGHTTAISDEPLIAAQRGDGSWPGPVDLDATIGKEGFTETTGLTFYQRYHTTLVAWMALTGRPSHQKLRTFDHLPKERPFDVRETYAALDRDWLELWDAFCSLRSDGPVLAPPAALATEPQAVLSYLEWTYWQHRLDSKVQKPFAQLAEMPATIAAAAATGEWRQLRCALLGCDIAALEPSQVSSLLDLIVGEKEEKPSDLLAAPAIDRLVSRALLQRHKIQPNRGRDTAFAETIEHRLLRALHHRDIFTLGPLLAFGGEFLDGGLWRLARRFMGEQRSHSLPYGYLPDAGDLERRRCFAALCYIPQADLWARIAAHDRKRNRITDA